jgi:hypothetical protein
MSRQFNLDFSRPAISVDGGKKTERITFTASSDLREFLNTFSIKQNVSISELCQKYIIDGLQRDLGSMLLVQANGEKNLFDLLRR